MLRNGSVNCSKQVLCWNCMYGINTAVKNIALHFAFNLEECHLCINLPENMPIKAHTDNQIIIIHLM